MRFPLGVQKVCFGVRTGPFGAQQSGFRTGDAAHEGRALPKLADLGFLILLVLDSKTGSVRRRQRSSP